MRLLVGSSLISGLAASLLFGCSLSTVGAMDPVEGGKCDTPMQTKKAADQCSECTCNGKTWECNSDACPTTCKAGDKKVAEDGCNSCSCGIDGKWTCSADQKCPGPTMPVCTPGDTKLRDDGCARCSCDDTGNWVCPTIACTKCAPGEMTKDDCQSCVCNADGNTWSCSGFFDGNCGTSPVCTPGDKTSSDCDDCLCNAAGTAWDCTPNMNPKCNPSGCKPGDVVPAGDDCNTCLCMADGQLACTADKCVEPACPPASMNGGTCPPQMIYALNPMTLDCCAYSSKCEAPQGWEFFTTPSCGITTPTMCTDPGTADCDGDPANGCETSILNDPQNCGSCGLFCMSPQGVPAICDQGKCTYAMGPGTCLYGGVEYVPGQSFPSRDGCNTCGCVSANGEQASIACTERACMCDPGAEPYRKYVATGAKNCDFPDHAVDFTCPDNTTSFYNDCGCGCEQSTDCPSAFSCKPDPMTMKSNCDMGLMARCPYSALLP